MGREIRMVPPNWVHPFHSQHGEPRLQPMYDQTFDQAAKEWKEEYRKWSDGERPSHFEEGDDGEFWEWHGSPPERDYYRPYSDEEATWFQVWETVSEGTPVSPPFATKEELVAYLAEHGDFWDQKRSTDPVDCRLFGLEYGKSGWGLEAATRFVGRGWAPSMIMTHGTIIDGKLAG